MLLSCLYESTTHNNVGIFIKLPKNLAIKFPKLKEDSSDPHITILYLGDQKISNKDKILAAALEVVNKTEQFSIKLDGLDYFDKNKDGQTVAYVKINSDSLRKLHTKLSVAMKQHGVKWTDTYGKYVPHVTLAYLDHGQEYDGKVPSGSFNCDSVEMWGFNKQLTLKFV